MLQIPPTNKKINFSSTEEAINLVTNVPESTPILVDFDETLFLRNSTEEYLNSLQPRILGTILLGFLSLLKPWNWLPGSMKGDVSRDWMRVLITTLFFPWTLIIWQWKAKRLAQNYENTALIQALKSRADCSIFIATLGFNFIVSPIIKHLPLKINSVISCRFWPGGIDRVKGKLQMVIDALGKDAVANSLVITDSNDDESLLLSASQPCLVLWSKAKYVPAMADVYIPFFYIEKVKQPNQQFLLKVILTDDLLFLILSSSWLSPQPIFHALSMTFLMLSFWCIYEIGYMENDLIAEYLEKKPKLSKTYQRYKQRINLWQPWIWSVLLALPGIFFLEFTQKNFPNQNLNLVLNKSQLLATITHFGLWFGLLLLVRGSFWIYNRVDKKTRVWLYPVLQLYKCFGFLVVTVTNIVGVMFFVAQVVSRWIPYIIYRYANADWPQGMGLLFRYLLFSFLMIAVALGNQNIYILWNWQTGLIFALCLIRGSGLLWELLHQIHPISEDCWGINKISRYMDTK